MDIKILKFADQNSLSHGKSKLYVKYKNSKILSMLIRLAHTSAPPANYRKRHVIYFQVARLAWSIFCTSHLVVVRHLASISSLCLEPDAHIWISANDAA